MHTLLVCFLRCSVSFVKSSHAMQASVFYISIDIDIDMDI